MFQSCCCCWMESVVWHADVLLLPQRLVTHSQLQNSCSQRKLLGICGQWCRHQSHLGGTAILVNWAQYPRPGTCCCDGGRLLPKFEIRVLGNTTKKSLCGSFLGSEVERCESTLLECSNFQILCTKCLRVLLPTGRSCGGMATHGQIHRKILVWSSVAVAAVAGVLHVQQLGCSCWEKSSVKCTCSCREGCQSRKSMRYQGRLTLKQLENFKGYFKDIFSRGTRWRGALQKRKVREQRFHWLKKQKDARQSLKGVRG